MTVKANWRIIFRFEEDHAYDVELLESHKADKEKTAMPMKNPPHPYAGSDQGRAPRTASRLNMEWACDARRMPS